MNHSPAKGLANMARLGSILNLHLFAWPSSLLFLPLVALRPRLGLDLLAAAVILALVAGHVFYYWADFRFGPRYWYEAAPFLAWLTARGLGGLDRFLEALSLPSSGHRTALAAVALFTAFGSFCYIGPILRLYGNDYGGLAPLPAEAVRDGWQGGDALIFVPQWKEVENNGFSSPFLANPVDLAGLSRIDRAAGSPRSRSGARGGGEAGAPGPGRGLAAPTEGTCPLRPESWSRFARADRRRLSRAEGLRPGEACRRRRIDHPKIARVGRRRRGAAASPRGRPLKGSGFVMEQTGSGRARAFVAPAVVSIAALALRFLQAGEPIWHDEAYSFHLARLSWQDLVSQLREESTPPLYYLLLKIWIAWFGDSEFAMRSLSALFSAATAALACAFASRHVSRRVGWCFGLLLAFNPAALYYGREVRMYALWELLTLLGLWGAVSFAKAHSRGGLVMAALANLLACYTHNVALIAVASTALVTVLVLEGRRARSAWILVHGGVGLLFLPWFLVVLTQVARQSTVLAWFEPHWEGQGPLLHVADSIAALTTGPFPDWMGLSAPWSARIPGVAVALLLAVSGAIALRRERVAPIFGLSSLLFVLLSVGYSAAVQPIFIPGRTDHALLVPLLFFVSVHMGREPWRRVRTAVVSAWGLLCLALALHQYGEAPKSTAAPVWEALAQRVRHGDVVVAAGLGAGEASYAHHRSRTRAPFEFFPASAGEHVGYTNFRELAEGEERSASGSPFEREALGRAAGGHVGKPLARVEWGSRASAPGEGDLGAF